MGKLDSIGTAHGARLLTLLPAARETLNAHARIWHRCFTAVSHRFNCRRHSEEGTESGARRPYDRRREENVRRPRAFRLAPSVRSGHVRVEERCDQQGEERYEERCVQLVWTTAWTKQVYTGLNCGAHRGVTAL